jgi:hypothetical protein
LCRGFGHIREEQIEEECHDGSSRSAGNRGIGQERRDQWRNIPFKRRIVNDSLEAAAPRRIRFEDDSNVIIESGQ